MKTTRRRTRRSGATARPSRAVTTARAACAPVIEQLEKRELFALFLNDIDSSNLGKGMWAWNLSDSMANDGFGTNYTGWFNYLKNTQHLNYVILKAGNGDVEYAPSNSPFGANTPQYTTALVNAAHNVGLKIVPYFYIYGDASDTSPASHHSSAEAAVFNSVFGAGGPGGDFAVFDIESEYGDNDVAGLQNYFNLIGKSVNEDGSGSRDRLFMAYSSFDILHFHNTQFPVKTIADYCDVAMPQMYWKAHGYTISFDLSTTDTDYSNVSLVGSAGLKPVIPTGQTYDSGNGLPTATETNQWYAAIKADTSAVGGGIAGYRYKSLNYFDEHTTNASLRTEIAAETIGDLPGTPTLVSPANNASGLSRNGLTLDWSDVVNTFGTNSVGAALYYDVYIDNTLKTTLAYSTTTGAAPASQWTISPQISGGTHTWKIVARNMFGATTSATNTFSVTVLPTPATPANPSPANNGYSNTPNVTLDWDDSANATSYDVYLGTSTTPTATVSVSQYGPLTPSEGTRLWRVVARNVDAAATGPQWQYTRDTVAPTATFGNQTPTGGAATFDFTVTYADSTAGMDTATFGNNDVLVTGPSSFSQNATYVTRSGNVVTYRINAPGGTWDANDNGTYTVTVNSNEVKDLASNAVANTSIGTVNVNLVQPFAYMVGSTLHVDFDGTATPIALATSGANVVATKGVTSLTFAGVIDITATGTSSDDRLQISAPVSPPITFNNSSGNDLVEVTGGTYQFSGDAGGPNGNVGVFVASGAAAVFNASQRLRSLSVDGTATLAAGGDKIIVTKALAVAGKLNLKDNDLAYDYTGSPQAGSFNGTSYTGVTGLVQSGYNFGDFNGNGIVTDMTDAVAPSSLTTLAVAEASDVFGLGPSDTTLFDGATVDGTTVLVKYTYAGDANLDGSITGDDYFQIDSAFPAQSTGWLNGDFNYDGSITGDDYFLIDSNFPGQGLPL